MHRLHSVDGYRMSERHGLLVASPPGTWPPDSLRSGSSKFTRLIMGSPAPLCPPRGVELCPGWLQGPRHRGNRPPHVLPPNPFHSTHTWHPLCLMIYIVIHSFIHSPKAQQTQYINVQTSMYSEEQTDAVPVCGAAGMGPFHTESGLFLCPPLSSSRP